MINTTVTSMNTFEEKYTFFDIVDKIACSRRDAIFLDKISRENDCVYYGIKYITFNENIFCGHFPQYPIVPGVLQIESAFQCAIVILKDKLDIGDNTEIYLKQLNNVKFRKPIHPGDVLINKLEITNKNFDENITINVTSYNNNSICSQSQMILSTRSKNNINNNKIIHSNIYKHSNSMNFDKILEYMPHRYPFSMIDYIYEDENNKNDNETEYIIGIKNITGSDPTVYSYMSPNNSVLTGPIFCEIMAQAGGVKILSRTENRGKLAIFMSIPRANFYSSINIGCQLKMEIKLPNKQSKFGKGSGQGYIDDKLVADGEMIFLIQ